MIKSVIKNPRSQLRKVFQVIGTPTEADIATVSNPSIRRALAELDMQQPQDFGTLYPSACPKDLEILAKTLTFNPVRCNWKASSFDIVLFSHILLLLFSFTSGLKSILCRRHEPRQRSCLSSTGEVSCFCSVTKHDCYRLCVVVRTL